MFSWDEALENFGHSTALRTMDGEWWDTPFNNFVGQICIVVAGIALLVMLFWGAFRD
jgi:hypothetical protein